MADIFISYAHEDRARVEPLTRALTDEGYTVWWDRELAPGQDYHDVIEDKVERAACVIVLWSEASRASRAVRAEAEAALERGVLVPARLEDVKPPLLFRSVQYEDLIGWSGDRAAEEFRRVMIQVAALVLGQEAAQGADDPGRGEAPAKAQPRGGPAERARRGGGLFRSPGSLVTLLAILGGGAALFVQPEEFLGEYWALVLGLAALAVTLFQFAERDLSAPSKAIARRWLAPKKGGVAVTSAEAFLHLFEAAFGRKHFSFDGFVRSAIASLVFFTALFILLYNEPIFNIDPTTLFFVFTFASVANVIGDYISLYETRVLLRWAKRHGGLAAVAVLDLALTTTVYIVVTGASIWATILVEGGGDVDEFRDIWLRVLTFVWDSILASVSGGPTPTAEWDDEASAMVLASFTTTYLTSIWLWLALAFAPVFRAIALSASSGETWVGRLFNVRGAPIAALGYLTAAVILALGGALWSVSWARGAPL